MDRTAAMASSSMPYDPSAGSETPSLTSKTSFSSFTSSFTSTDVSYPPNKQTLLQGFEWYVPPDKKHWKRLESILPTLARLGVKKLHIPPACKAFGPESVGKPVSQASQQPSHGVAGLPLKEGLHAEQIQDTTSTTSLILANSNRRTALPQSMAPSLRSSALHIWARPSVLASFSMLSSLTRLEPMLWSQSGPSALSSWVRILLFVKCSFCRLSASCKQLCGSPSLCFMHDYGLLFLLNFQGRSQRRDR